MSVFPKEQFLILRSEDLFQQPEETMKQVFEFLELPDYQFSSYPHYNSGVSYQGTKHMIMQKMTNFFKTFNQLFEIFLSFIERI